MVAMEGACSGSAWIMRALEFFAKLEQCSVEANKLKKYAQILGVHYKQWLR
jgi:hypothetical protein